MRGAGKYFVWHLHRGEGEGRSELLLFALHQEAIELGTLIHMRDWLHFIFIVSSPMKLEGHTGSQRRAAVCTHTRLIPCPVHTIPRGIGGRQAGRQGGEKAGPQAEKNLPPFKYLTFLCTFLRTLRTLYYLEYRPAYSRGTLKTLRGPRPHLCPLRLSRVTQCFE